MADHFVDKLTAAVERNRSLLCVGLDPEPSYEPGSQVFNLNRILIEATADVACAYKPNLAIYESMGPEGLEALQKTIDYIRSVNHVVPIIGDAKRGDIGNNSFAYAHTLLDNYKFDAVTVSPYMGSDSLAPFLSRGDKGIFVLCRTSNPGGGDLQDLPVLREDSSTRPLYEVVAELSHKWNERGNVGLVVGATYPEQLRRVRQICPEMLLLIPGVGPQGGDIAQTVSSAVDSSGGGFLINVSRKIMYAAKTRKGTLRKRAEAVKAVRTVSRELRDQINTQVAVVMEEGHSLGSRLDKVATPL